MRKSNKWKRIKQLILNKQQYLINKIRLIQSQSGTYRKAYKENPNVASVASEVFIDHSNKQFKHFYKFKIARKEILYLPLSYNKDFHNHFKNINLNANHYVSLNKKGQINIGLQENYIQTFKETISKEQIAGIDLNIKHNFCVINIDDNYIEYDYDRQFFYKQIQDLKAIDAIGYNQLSNENKNKLNKIVKRTETYFQYLVSEILDSLQNKAITEIVLEYLNLQKTGFKTFSEEFGVSYNRLVKILRLNQIKHWFKSQANKREIKVHFTSPCATSIECSECHTIDRDNRRKQEEFKCINCDNTTNADNQAALNIGNRIKLDVLRDRLHNYDVFGQCTPKVLKRDVIKSTIEDYYKKQSILNVDPLYSRLLRETNSKSLI
jgi:transposase